MWRVLYSEKDKEEIAELITEDITKRDVTIDSLIAGQTYTIRLFAVTTGDIASQVPAVITTTLSKSTNLNTWFPFE